MLIAYLKSHNPNYAEETEKCASIRDLEELYKNDKKKLDDDQNLEKFLN